MAPGRTARWHATAACSPSCRSRCSSFTPQRCALLPQRGSGVSCNRLPVAASRAASCRPPADWAEATRCLGKSNATSDQRRPLPDRTRHPSVAYIIIRGKARRAKQHLRSSAGARERFPPAALVLLPARFGHSLASLARPAPRRIKIMPNGNTTQPDSPEELAAALTQAPQELVVATFGSSSVPVV